MPSRSLEGIILNKDRYANIKYRKSFKGSTEG
jgi:hypothetical protein